MLDVNETRVIPTPYFDFLWEDQFHLAGTTQLILLTFVSILLSSKWFQWRKERKKYPPGPVPLPLIGNLANLGPSPHLSLMKMKDTYGPIIQFQMGVWPAIALNSASLAHDALIGQREDFVARPEFASFKYLQENKGITFGPYNPRWKLTKKLVRKCLQKHSTTAVFEEFLNHEAETMVQELQSDKTEPTDPKRKFEMTAASVVYGLCFGYDRRLRDDTGFHRFLETQDAFNRFQGAGKNITDILPWTKIFASKNLLEFIDIATTLHNLVIEKHKERKNAPVSDCILESLVETTQNLSENDKTQLKIDDEHLPSCCEEIMGAGLQTASNLMNWAIVYMVTFPEIQKKVQEEIENVIGTERKSCGKDRINMPYTEATILEVMRYSASLPFLVPHAATRDTELGGYKVDKGTLVFINTYAMARDPAVWDRPTEFDPTRFIENCGTKIDRAKEMDFLPFGAGLRRCPGEQIARTEVFVLFTTLLQKCSLSGIPDKMPSLEGKFGFALEPHPYKVIIQKRDL